MGDWYLFLANDLQEIYHNIEIKDLAIYGYLALWITILAFPLVGVDTHDQIAGMVYMVYTSAGGVVLFFALPGNFTEVSDFNIHLAAMIGMSIVSGYRWFHKNNQVVISSETVTKDGGFNDSTEQ